MLRKGHPVLPQQHLGSGLAIVVLEAASRIVEGTRGRHNRFEEHDCGQSYRRRRRRHHYLQRSFAATAYQLYFYSQSQVHIPQHPLYPQ
jgi:hypothetical protein